MISEKHEVRGEQTLWEVRDRYLRRFSPHRTDRNDDSTLVCPCGSTFTWSLVDMEKLWAWIDIHGPHAPLLPSEKTSDHVWVGFSASDEPCAVARSEANAAGHLVAKRALFVPAIEFWRASARRDDLMVRIAEMQTRSEAVEAAHGAYVRTMLDERQRLQRQLGEAERKRAAMAETLTSVRAVIEELRNLPGIPAWAEKRATDAIAECEDAVRPARPQLWGVFYVGPDGDITRIKDGHWRLHVLCIPHATTQGLFEGTQDEATRYATHMMTVMPNARYEARALPPGGE
jgi:hypothetical protein